MVVKADPVCDHATGVLQGLESVAMHAINLFAANILLRHQFSPKNFGHLAEANGL